MPFAEQVADLPAELPGYLGQILQYGILGVIFVLLLTGVLVTKGQYTEMKRERDDWKATADKRQETIDTQQQTIDKLSASVTVAVENARMSTAILDKLGHIAAPLRGSSE